MPKLDSFISLEVSAVLNLRTKWLVICAFHVFRETGKIFWLHVNSLMEKTDEKSENIGRDMKRDYGRKIRAQTNKQIILALLI